MEQLQARLEAFAIRVGQKFKGLNGGLGNLSNLPTTTKESVVSAIEELHSLILAGGGGVGIDDQSTGAGMTWSSNKIAQALQDLKLSIIDGAPEALDTLKEIADSLSNNESAVGGLVTALANRVSFADIQNLTNEQKMLACKNIGVGNPDVDLVKIFEETLNAV